MHQQGTRRDMTQRTICSLHGPSTAIYRHTHTSNHPRIFAKQEHGCIDDVVHFWKTRATMKLASVYLIAPLRSKATHMTAYLQTASAEFDSADPLPSTDLPSRLSPIPSWPQSDWYYSREYRADRVRRPYFSWYCPLPPLLHLSMHTPGHVYHT